MSFYGGVWTTARIAQLSQISQQPKAKFHQFLIHMHILRMNSAVLGTQPHTSQIKVTSVVKWRSMNCACELCLWLWCNMGTWFISDSYKFHFNSYFVSVSTDYQPNEKLQLFFLNFTSLSTIHIYLNTHQDSYDLLCVALHQSYYMGALI